MLLFKLITSVQKNLISIYKSGATEGFHRRHILMDAYQGRTGEEKWPGNY